MIEESVFLVLIGGHLRTGTPNLLGKGFISRLQDPGRAGLHQIEAISQFDYSPKDRWGMDHLRPLFRGVFSPTPGQLWIILPEVNAGSQPIVSPKPRLQSALACDNGGCHS